VALQIADRETGTLTQGNRKVIEGAAILVARILAGLEQREVYDRKMD
tara:strand:- start:1652 stop:1792 length:141 start_codon:yes stop_codon:yes gene_type:complete